VNIIPGNFILLLRRTAYLVVIYFLCRLLFLLFNYSYFSAAGFYNILSSFFFGLRYDVTAIVISNVLFIFLHLVPFPVFYTKFYQGVLKFLFLLVNIPFILLNCVDLGLFRFTGKRSGAELISIMSFGKDFINTLPKLITDFWYLLLIFFLVIYLLNKFYPVLSETKVKPFRKNFTFSIFGKLILTVLFGVLTVIGFRGGTQFKPLNVLSASRYATGKTTALVLNTTFTIVKTYGKNSIEEKKWFSYEQSSKITPYIKVPGTCQPFKEKNVVLIILESFGKEYSGLLNSGTGHTPFLDSLAQKSLIFTNAYSNGKRSIEGIPSIVAGIPALMSDPFITSVYSGNTITTIPSLLKEKGYSTGFFHGGTNGTMNFDNFSKLSGYDFYFGRNEYNDDKDFDGSWGIFDEPFLQRTATEIDKMKAPFFVTVFTLSSHHPYSIPEKYVSQFGSGTLPIHRSIRYADYSLQKFFETASTMPWYENTLFVLTADHTALSENPFYMNRVGLYAIPMIYFSPGDSLLTGMNPNCTQQIDILPSVMDYLNYDRPYFALGKSVFDESGKGFAINLIDGSFQLIEDGKIFIMDDKNNSLLYNFTSDSSLSQNLSETDTLTSTRMEIKLKAVIQNFNYSIINNSMRP
jgi:phosphoglycerol transferase MdoB-like AlkP superfamily enzyme